MNSNLRTPDYRAPWERAILFLSIALMTIVLFGLIKINIWVVIIIITISVAVVKIQQGQLLGNSVKVSENVLPEVYEACKEAAQRLSMRMPDVFVRQDPVINAFAIGFWGRKSVVLNSKTVECMNREELISILGHEFSHIRCHHTNWLVITNSAETIRVPLVSPILGVIFLWWSRRAEYTADRGGLLACRNLNSSVSALAKLMVGEELYDKLDFDKLLGQEQEVGGDIIAKVSEIIATHPYMVRRVRALHRYRQSTECQSLIVNGAPPNVNDFQALLQELSCLHDALKHKYETARDTRTKEQIKALKREIESLKREHEQEPTQAKNMRQRKTYNPELQRYKDEIEEIKRQIESLKKLKELWSQDI